MKKATVKIRRKPLLRFLSIIRIVFLGKILGVATSAGLTTMEMLDIATRRITGTTPIRPGVYKEYALAYEWTEAALSTIPPAADENDPNKKRSKNKLTIVVTPLEAISSTIKCILLIYLR